MTNEVGTYALLLRSSDACTLEVGALGTMTVQPGAYVYVGSAFGPGGVRARVQRHARGDGATHWHVDYLRTVTTLDAVWYTHDSTRRECDWASVLRDLSTARVPLSGFGASDCACPAHLVALQGRPSFSDFRERVWADCPDHAPMSKVERADEIRR
jgi:Uri superfamily endonuclease